MPWMYFVAFALGTVFTTAGSAAQIVLTQVVPRERLVEAHAKNALASSGAEVVGPGLAGLLIRVVGAPVALLVDAAMLLWSAWILRGVRVHERRDAAARCALLARPATPACISCAGTRLLVALAAVVGCWQMFHQAAMVVNILFATRELGLNEQQIGGCFVALGAGTVLASVFGNRLSRRIGPGPSMPVAIGVCGVGWLLLARGAGQCLGRGGVRVHAVRVRRRRGADLHQLPGDAAGGHARAAAGPHDQHDALADPACPAGPGALIGGWLGEHVGLRAALVFAGVGGVAAGRRGGVAGRRSGRCACCPSPTAR